MSRTGRFILLAGTILLISAPVGWNPGGSSTASSLADLDFGDAEYLGSWGGYPTLLAQDGARHNIGGPWLGDASDSPDIEPDGQPDVSALGDDADGNDDENGASIETLYPGHTSYLHIEVSGGGGIVEVWIDFDHDRHWDHPGEQVFAGYLADGSHTIQVATVTNATIGQTVARFRISTAGDLSPTGEAADGEVEDHTVQIEAPSWDFGDAPDGVGATLYPTLQINNGARHLARGPWLGDSRDAPDTEADGQPHSEGLGDDNDGGDDENGVDIPTLLPGNPANLSFIVSGGGGYVDGWIDYDGDKSWLDTGEKIISGYYADGFHSIMITVPDDAQPGQTFARFRISNTGGLLSTGAADYGEVEDYEVIISDKCEQPPDVDTTGIAVTMGEFFIDEEVADDFECRQPGYIREIRFWIALKDDAVGIEEIYLWDFYIMSDLPSAESPTGYAIPDSVLWYDYFYYYNSDITVSVWDPAISIGWHEGDHLYYPAATVCYLVTLTIPDSHPFFQTGTPEDPVTYWLKIHARPASPAGYEIGWLASTEHGGACAVYRDGGDLPQLLYPSGHMWVGENIDMAFKIISEPGQELDYGDAPDDIEFAAYPTLYSHDGARHVIAGPWLGDASGRPDGELDGQPDPGALGDDNHDGDDENGIQIPVLVIGESVDITVEVSGGGGYLQGWIDFDRDETWDNATEMVVAQTLSDGVHVLPVSVPDTAQAGTSFARFRISSGGDLQPVGLADDGEVEDYEVTIQDQSTGAEDELHPSSFRLYQSFPNPFNPVTEIHFDLPAPQRVTIAVFAADGSRIATIADRDMTAGRHRVTWDGRNDRGRPVASGVYFYRIKAGPYVETRRMVLLR